MHQSEKWGVWPQQSKDRAGGLGIKRDKLGAPATVLTPRSLCIVSSLGLECYKFPKHQTHPGSNASRKTYSIARSKLFLYHLPFEIMSYSSLFPQSRQARINYVFIKEKKKIERLMDWPEMLWGHTRLVNRRILLGITSPTQSVTYAREWVTACLNFSC